MYVRPAYQRRGLARAVLAELERTAAEAGITRLILETGLGSPRRSRSIDRRATTTSRRSATTPTSPTASTSASRSPSASPRAGLRPRRRCLPGRHGGAMRDTAPRTTPGRRRPSPAATAVAEHQGGPQPSWSGESGRAACWLGCAPCVRSRRTRYAAVALPEAREQPQRPRPVEVERPRIAAVMSASSRAAAGGRRSSGERCENSDVPPWSAPAIETMHRELAACRRGGGRTVPTARASASRRPPGTSRPGRPPGRMPRPTALSSRDASTDSAESERRPGEPRASRAAAVDGRARQGLMRESGAARADAPTDPGRHRRPHTADASARGSRLAQEPSRDAGTHVGARRSRRHAAHRDQDRRATR